ncbi:MAG: hypothetical protein AB7F28_02555 [Candidatus Margulisiibacteriota bacterium]
MPQLVSDIDFTICAPKPGRDPYWVACLATGPHHCPVVAHDGTFIQDGDLCKPQQTDHFHLSMDCPHRDAFSPEFYAWLASLDLENDCPFPEAIGALQEASPSVIFLTNRNEACRPKTEAFLSKFAIPYQGLQMRKNGDYRPLWAFKQEAIWTLANQHDSLVWVDDQKPPFDLPANTTWVLPTFYKNPILV